MKMFQKIQELIDEPETIVCVLIDEVKLQAFLLLYHYYKTVCIP